MILYGDKMPHSPFKIVYEAIHYFSNNSTSDDDQMDKIIDEYSYLSCLEPNSMFDPFKKYFLTDEGILEVMTLDEMPWDDTHYSSTFLPSFDKIENNLSSLFSYETLSDP